MSEPGRFPGVGLWVGVFAVGVSAPAAVWGQDVQPPASQNPQISLYYQGLNPRGDFAFKWKDQGNHTRPVGTLNWSVPGEFAGTRGMGRDFRAFCAESLVGVTAGNTYRF